MSPQPHNRIDRNTWVPLSAAIAIILAVIGGTWKICDEVNSFRNDIRRALTDQWSARDMQDWSYAFRDQNRGLNLAVPDPRKIRADRIAIEQPGGGAGQ